MRKLIIFKHKKNVFAVFETDLWLDLDSLCRSVSEDTFVLSGRRIVLSVSDDWRLASWEWLFFSFFGPSVLLSGDPEWLTLTAAGKCVLFSFPWRESLFLSVPSLLQPLVPFWLQAVVYFTTTHLLALEFICADMFCHPGAKPDATYFSFSLLCFVFARATLASLKVEWFKGLVSCRCLIIFSIHIILETLIDLGRCAKFLVAAGEYKSTKWPRLLLLAIRPLDNYLHH